MSICVIILTFNEEANLPAALDSIRGWAKEVFVVDSYSTDRTVDIALERASDGVKVVQHSFENYSAQWNWALSHLPVKSEWTLKLDADERVTPEFKGEVEHIFQTASQDLEGIYFRRLITFMEHPFRWGNMIENYDLRLWRSGKAIFENREVNEHAIVKGQTTKIRSFVLHNSFKSLSDWLDKHNRYASLEARCYLEGKTLGDIKPRFFGTHEQRRIWIRKMLCKVPFNNLLYFIYRYVLSLGFIDGRMGFRYAFLHAVYKYWIFLKIQEYYRTGVLPEVIWPLRGQPHPRVECSELQKLVDSSKESLKDKQERA